MSVKGRSKRLEWLKSHAAHASDECLLWPFSRIWNGYGNFQINGRVRYAHRAMCELVHGAPPVGYVAAHSCGRGQDGCVNPRHISWKSPADNQLDRRAHGTDKRKKKWFRTRSTVTPEQRAEIIALKGKKNQREIGKMFGISYQHVSLIQRGLHRQPKRI